MDEIKRARVPFKRSLPAAAAHSQAANARPAAGAKAADPLQKLGETSSAEGVRARQRPVLDGSHVADVAFRGNVLTGTTLDSRTDLPPFCFNPPPATAMASRRGKLSRTYAKPTGIQLHPSHSKAYGLLLNRKTRQAAMLQRLVNTNPLVRAAFEKATVSRVVPDQRADGTLSLVSPGALSGSNIGVSSHAMTAPPPRDFYAILNELDQVVLRQAAEIARAQQQSANATSSGVPTFPFSSAFTFDGSGSSSDPFRSEEEDEESGESSWQPVSNVNVGRITPITGPNAGTVNGANNSTGGSVDEGAAKLQVMTQRLNQMYSLIHTMFSKWAQASNATLNNIK